MSPPSPLPFSFLQAQAPPELADLLETLWVARGTIAYGRERILPSVRPVLIINLGSPFRVQASRHREGDGIRTDGWLVGPQTGYVENEPLAETNVVGATLRPWAPSALFGISASEIRDRVVDLDLLWGPGFGRLRAGLEACVEGRARMRLLARSLALRPRLRLPGLIDHAMDRLAQPRAARVAAVSAELSISRKHLSALFGRYIGLSPGTFARVERFGQTLECLAGPVVPPLARLAHDHGYYDQAHMNRDFISFGGITPTEYLARRARHMTSDGDESGLFVPGL
jgi:AraC-like DNA-binding protein